MTPNSTVPGDAMRMSAGASAMAAEAGAFATVLNAVGQYQLNAAHATAIDSATMMAWNEYYHAILNEQERRNRLHRTRAARGSSRLTTSAGIGSRTTPRCWTCSPATP